LHLVLGAAPEDGGAQVLEELPSVLPLQLLAPRELPDLLERLAEEVNRRLKESTVGEPLFLILHGLQRLRDLRRPDDDFGLRRQEKQSPFQQFVHIAREGPPLGVFTILCCDTLGNLQRTLDRQALREFEMRVLFQMSATDSSTLIDSPIAAKLGLHRAFFYAEDQGKLEKFRPYGLPALEWLRETCDTSCRRGTT
jgi:hypothetical protein